MKAVYIRISTSNQSVQRQLKKDTSIVPFIDICSGSIPFEDRTNAKLLMKAKDITCIEVKEVSRLGRNLRDILKTIDYFTEKGIDIYIANQGLHTLLEDGSKNPTAQMIIAILGTIAQQERELLIERTKEGVAIAKALGKFKGRKVGAKSKVEVKNNILITAIQSKLNEGMSITKVASECSTSRQQIYNWMKEGFIKRA